MTIKTLRAIAILSAALSSPAFAQDVRGPADRGPTHRLQHYRRAYNQAPMYAPYYTGAPAPRGWAGEEAQYDRSFPGGHDPDLNPPGN